MLAVWKREVQNYFLTPIGYVFMGVFLLGGGILFFLNNVLNEQANVIYLFGNLSFLCMILVPILTMRLMSEERRTKTDQLLLTSPATIPSIVIGKFLSACTVLLVTMFIASFYVVVIASYTFTSPYAASGATYGAIVTNYLGFFLMCCSYIAIGTLMSTLTESQVSAAVLTFGTILLLQILEGVLPNLSVPYMPFLPALFSWLSLEARYTTFTAGMLSLADVIYFVSFCGILLFLAVRVIDKRRWSEG